MPDAAVDLSLVIPLFNEEAVFPELLSRLHAVIATIQEKGLAVEVVFIDDGSHDATPELIRGACAAHPWARGLALSRNFGHQTAITAGMHHTRGKAVAILDGDLQDPPEVILEFHAKLAEGYDVVYAVRRERKESIFKRMAYAGFYRLMRRMATIPIPLDSGDFCLMSRRVVKTINAMPERHRFVRGMRSWVGFKQTSHSYPRAARAAGTSKYSLRKLVKLALDGIFTFSEKPLQWVTLMGVLVALGAFAWGIYVLIWRFTGKPSPELQGWATLAVGMLFLGGVQLISIGILGEYIGRIHNEVKGRPLFVIDQRWGFPEEPDAG